MSTDDPAPLGPSNTAEKAFLITIDTEGDNLWSKPREITVRNAGAIPRFQELCERYGLRPTYLVNWEMVNCGPFVEFAKDVLDRGEAEVGMHLHAWNSPPLERLTADDFTHQPYLTEYPEAVLREKVHVMTETLESVFLTKMRSHRAGRWGLDGTYVRALIDEGYLVDCSVTPHVDWRAHPGDPAGSGGPDFRTFPEAPYFMDPADISRPGSSSLLQVPMTIVSHKGAGWSRPVRETMGRVGHLRPAVNRLFPAYWWLRPNGRNGQKLLELLAMAEDEQRGYVEFMLHSSELLAGGSPTFPTDESIEALYRDLEALFAAASREWKGMTLGSYREGFDVVQQGDALGPH